MPLIRRALISVSDKRGLVDFASSLHAHAVEIISTGGTRALLTSEGIPARSVSEVTGFPEILDGRVKTLHPRIHGALLAIYGNPSHDRQLAEQGIEPIDMVVVNLYPFEQTVRREGVDLDHALENIDIGGPAMVRAAAKNFRSKAVVVSPDRYPAIISELDTNGGSISEETCFSLAQEAFAHTAGYDAVVAQYLERLARPGDRLPAIFHVTMPKDISLRYGENPHQHAALYGSFSSLFQSLHGKELSYNNIVDIVAASTLASEFEEPTVAIIKHTNPCGVGSGSTLTEAYSKALTTDPKSAFGGIVAANRPLDPDVAAKINDVFTEVIVAPGFPEPVLDLLRRKKDRRLVRLAADLRTLAGFDLKGVPGGLLVQDRDTDRVSRASIRVVTRRAPTAEEIRGLLYAWRVAMHVKSNAIVYARGDRTVGIGAGQMSRVDSARLAAEKAREAGLDIAGTAVASDAFFPFPDGLLEAVRAGSTSVIQPGGSVRDDEVIRAADEHGIAMVFTGIRHFKH